MTPLAPEAVMAQIAAALPDDCRSNVIIIGSLAAGYHFFAGDGQRSIRTKDVDCMFSPHAKAVAAAGQVAERLLASAWQPRKEGKDSLGNNVTSVSNAVTLAGCKQSRRLRNVGS
jgi:hypothetical protein